MIHIDKYYFEWGNGLVQFNSLSPNHKYYYQIKKPDDLYWGLFVAKIAFYSINNKLIYFTNLFADPINDSITNKIKYASFSIEGNHAYFRERESIDTLYHVILSLDNGTYKRMKWKESDDYGKLENDEFNNESLSIFSGLNWQKAKVSIKFNRSIFGKKLWYPG